MEDEKNIIEFDYSSSGIPIIILGDLGTLTFSKITSHPDKGYKFLCFSHYYDDVIKIRDKNGGERSTVVPTNDSYTVNMNLERKPKTHNAKASGLPHGVLPSRMKDFMKKSLKPYTDDEGYIHFNDIELIKKKIEGKEIEKILDKVQKKRKKKKPKKKKKS